MTLRSEVKREVQRGHCKQREQQERWQEGIWWNQEMSVVLEV